MADLERAQKRNAKIMRTLVRLKHSLAADEEIAEHLAAQKALILQGEVPRLELDLSDLAGD
jgi:hypothetical protein